ncbi:PQQ-dependent sugar dehydrogenase [Nocardioidaceae bacterium]|nr:PQQ-dependent sugar dehydrogenase [Nocardioidaceae bacterium]
MTEQPRVRRPFRLLAAAASLVTLAAGLAACGDDTDTGPEAGVPDLRVRTVASGLSVPWDVAVLPGGPLLVTERESTRLMVVRGGTAREVGRPGNAWASGETGLMSVALDKRFGRNDRFYTCRGWTDGSRTDVRVTAWRMNEDYTRARETGVVIDGFPTSSGRHGGCRLEILRDGSMLVGTGDAALSSTPQDKRSLGGKTLRLNPRTGQPYAKNPWVNARNENRRYVWTYGHRNLQGLAQRRDGTLWSAEHGPDRDDEVNLLRKGGNYGWDPGPGYDEGVPMTDRSLPGRQIGARWSSGVPTLAVSGADWVRGKRWGRLNGTLAVAGLKSSRLVFMKFDRDGELRWTRSPAALQQDGRLRSVQTTKNGALLVTTSNGSNDKVLRVVPGGGGS